ncbi:MAG: DUF3083 family protein [Alteromonadaceae bacterium]|nr:DUF3083 family protein [Alteromonadaceae bacterium]
MSIIRKRSAAHKTYLPGNAQDNQYIMAEFSVTDELIDKFTDSNTLNQTDTFIHTGNHTYNKTGNQTEKLSYLDFYHGLSTLVFKLSHELGLGNCLFIATKDKRTEHGYGRFLNQIELAMSFIANKLELSPAKDEVIIRFHQHIGYDL